LLENCRINPRDAIHIASALEKKITEIISDDADLDIIKEIQRIPF
jgi:predicted nucleic acid-binding protein